MNTQPYPMMTHEEFVHPRLSPYDPTIQEAKDLLIQLDKAAQRLANAISRKQQNSLHLERVKRHAANAEAQEIFLAEVDSATHGPLKGIAKTSKAYEHAIKALLVQAKGLKPFYESLQQAEDMCTEAMIEYEQAETLYNALKYKAGLLSAILNASRS